MADEHTDSPRPRGRPRSEEPGTTVSAWVSEQEHDKLIRLANEQEKSVSALVRQLIVPKLP